MAKLKEYIIDAQDKGMKLETGAKSLLDDYTKLRKQYDPVIKSMTRMV